MRPEHQRGARPRGDRRDRAGIEAADGVRLLDVDPGADTNRTVITFVGPPAAVVEGAFRAIRRAAELIDMTRHTGAHPRQGATDVCPFVPVTGVTMEDCVALARAVGERVGRELGIPVYLYEHAATRPERRALSDIRVGEYEALEAKLKEPEWAPDYGPATFVPRTGAVVIGAREFLIAYNVDLNTRDRGCARGRPRHPRDRAPGATPAATDPRTRMGTRSEGRDGLQAVRAVGWYIEKYGKAQVSINLPNYQRHGRSTKPSTLRARGRQAGLRVTGSELVGLIPLEAMRLAGRTTSQAGNSTGVPEKELVHVAVQSLGLNDISPFDPEKKIIEYRVREGRALSSTAASGTSSTSSRATPPRPAAEASPPCAARSGPRWGRWSPISRSERRDSRGFARKWWRSRIADRS